jgi:hypothetical protein
MPTFRKKCTVSIFLTAVKTSNITYLLGVGFEEMTVHHTNPTDGLMRD